MVWHYDVILRPEIPSSSHIAQHLIGHVAIGARAAVDHVLITQDASAACAAAADQGAQLVHPLVDTHVPARPQG